MNQPVHREERWGYFYRRSDLKADDTNTNEKTFISTKNWCVEHIELSTSCQLRSCVFLGFGSVSGGGLEWPHSAALTRRFKTAFKTNPTSSRRKRVQFMMRMHIFHEHLVMSGQTQTVCSTLVSLVAFLKWGNSWISLDSSSKPKRILLTLCHQPSLCTSGMNDATRESATQHNRISAHDLTCPGLVVILMKAGIGQDRFGGF